MEESELAWRLVEAIYISKLKHKLKFECSVRLEIRKLETNN